MSSTNPSLADVRAARSRLADAVPRTPLVRLRGGDAPAEIHLKLENLQPIGSFKLRGAGNAMAVADPAVLAGGVVTASAGNMAQGVAWHARRLGVPCHVVVPDDAPRAKLDAIEGLGAQVVVVSFERWWRALVERSYPGIDGVFVHPVCDPTVQAGNGAIALEILEDLPDVDAVVVPFGGGGLVTGIASVMRALRPEVRVFACEVETAAPLAAALEAGRPVRVHREPSFVDGIGAATVLDEMWPRVHQLVADSLVVSLSAVAAALRRLATDNHVVAEGAGAAPVAAALEGRAGTGRIACIVSGGNIDRRVLASLLTDAPDGLARRAPG